MPGIVSVSASFPNTVTNRAPVPQKCLSVDETCGPLRSRRSVSVLVRQDSRCYYYAVIVEPLFIAFQLLGPKMLVVNVPRTVLLQEET